VTAVAPPVLLAVLWVLVRTLRVEFEGIEPVEERWRRGERVLLTFWHGRLLGMAIGARITDARVCILVSRHRDGEIADRVLRHWGVETVRGSTTRGAVAGFRRLVLAHRRGFDLGVVPDGPRGPCCVAQSGVVYLAKATGAVIVPVSFAADRAWRLRSWDRMVIPKPFARVRIEVGEPTVVPRDADDAAVEALRERIEAVLNELTERAETRVQRVVS
jgi:hypothetical protein